MEQRRHQRHHQRIDVVERQRHHHPVGLGQLVHIAGAARIGDQVRMAEQHALGNPGGARGVHDQRRLAGLDAMGQQLPRPGAAGQHGNRRHPHGLRIAQRHAHLALHLRQRLLQG